MPNPITVFKGIVHGKMIELEREPGLPDGEAVTVTVQRTRPAPPETTSEDLPSVELWSHRLIFNSTVLLGERIVKGTNLAVEALLAELERGPSDEDMLRAHPELTREDLQALRVYARVPAWIRRTTGAWAEHADEVDQFVEWTYEQRKNDRRPLEL
jgi:uncharacterized protein (DUF433 family)